MVLFTRARPPPRFHNGTLLTGGHTGTGPPGAAWLRPDQAGTYHCKAWNDASRAIGHCPTHRAW